MKVLIRGFRCYEEKDFDFETEKITMLSGKSGAGKSTIFAAIFWCLFGTVKSIHHHTKKYKKPNVTILLDSMSIFRQIAPALLKVNINGVEYENDIAQDKINKIFGNKNVWKATSYLSQKERNPLLTGSVADKMEILNSLSFSEDNIDQIIEKIEKKISNLEETLKIKNTIFETNNDSLKSRISKLDWSKYVKPGCREIVNLNDLQEKIKNLKVSISENNKLIGRKEYLESIVEKLESPVDLTYLKEKISKLEFLLSVSKLDIEDITPYLGHDLCSQEDLFSAKTKENDFKKSVELLKSIGHDLVDIKETKLFVENEISKLEKDLEENSMRKKAEELRKLKFENYSDNDLTDIKNKIKNIQDSLKNLTCPHCKKFVKLFNDSLIIADKCEVSKESLFELQRQKIYIENCLETKRKIETFYSDFETNTLDFQLPVDEKQTYSKLNILKNLKLDLPKFSFSFLEKLISVQNINSKITNEDIVESKITDFSVLPKLKNQLLNDEDLQIDKLKEELSKLKINYNLDSELETLEKELIENKEKIRLWELMDAIVKERDDLLVEQEKINLMEKKLKNTKELKILCLELECETLQKTVNNINNFLSKTVSNIFEDPININLMINKKILPSGRFKQEVYLNVLYKGGENDNISDLSGGEGDRVSLAMTLALSQMSNSPFMLLDESLASLDAELQEKCLESLKTDMKKTILSIEHESIEGYYDTILRLK